MPISRNTNRFPFTTKTMAPPEVLAVTGDAESIVSAICGRLTDVDRRLIEASVSSAMVAPTFRPTVFMVSMWEAGVLLENDTFADIVWDIVRAGVLAQIQVSGSDVARERMAQDYAAREGYGVFYLRGWDTVERRRHSLVDFVDDDAWMTKDSDGAQEAFRRGFDDCLGMFPVEYQGPWLYPMPPMGWDSTGRMISHSKSGYHRLYPDNDALFNAVVCTREAGHIWHGDLDVTRDADALVAHAKRLGCDLHVFSEHQGYPFCRQDGWVEGRTVFAVFTSEGRRL